MLTDLARLVERLEGAGFSPAVAAVKAELFGRCVRQLRGSGPDHAAARSGRAYFVPGRIEVLGNTRTMLAGAALSARWNGASAWRPLRPRIPAWNFHSVP